MNQIPNNLNPKALKEWAATDLYNTAVNSNNAQDIKALVYELWERDETDLMAKLAINKFIYQA